MTFYVNKHKFFDLQEIDIENFLIYPSKPKIILYVNPFFK